MRHQADILWLEELRRNLACYFSSSSALDSNCWSNSVPVQITTQEDKK